VLKDKYPELAQVLIDKAARERLEREEKQREQAKIREQRRQEQAQKSKQNSRDWDMDERVSQGHIGKWVTIASLTLFKVCNNVLLLFYEVDYYASHI
jgi:hypothetical protein